MIFTRRYRYRFGDIDDAGVAYYPALFHYFHCCMEDWWSDALGTPYHRVLHHEHFGLPVVRIEADFHRPVRYGDEPDVHLGVLRLGRASLVLGFWMTRPDESKAVCRARITTASVDMRTFASQPIPAAWRAEFTRFQLGDGEFPSR